VETNPVTRTFVAKAGTPSPRVFAAAVGRATDAIRTGTGDLQNAGSAFECGV
jgi:hypothetical protein